VHTYPSVPPPLPGKDVGVGSGGIHFRHCPQMLFLNCPASSGDWILPDIRLLRLENERGVTCIVLGAAADARRQSWTRLVACRPATDRSSSSSNGQESATRTLRAFVLPTFATRPFFKLHVSSLEPQ
jgi:hypothetical protein